MLERADTRTKERVHLGTTSFGEYMRTKFEEESLRSETMGIWARMMEIRIEIWVGEHRDAKMVEILLLKTHIFLRGMTRDDDWLIDYPYKVPVIRSDSCADELKHLSNTHLNGREASPLAPELEGHYWPRKQIKNTVAIARKIAIRQESIVLFSHLKQAVAASKEFPSELNGPDHVSSVFL